MTNIKILRTAAEVGDIESMCELGRRLTMGDGVKKDLGKAIDWFEKAAEQNISNAQKNIGVSYYYGMGVVQGVIEAYKWLTIAKKNGVMNLEDLIKKVKKSLTKEEIVEAKKLAKEWLEKH